MPKLTFPYAHPISPRRLFLAVAVVLAGLAVIVLTSSSPLLRAGDEDRIQQVNLAVHHDSTVAEARSAPMLRAAPMHVQMAGMAGAPAAFEAPAPSLPVRMLIRTGTVRLRIDSLPVAMARAESLATRLGAQISETSVGAADARWNTVSMVIRTPAATFDRLVGAVGRLGKIEELQLGSEDVGEEYVDTEARLANARRLESRILTLLATRTARLNDVLTAERELARVREGIELMEGRRRYLDAHVAMATLRVEMTLPFTPTTAAEPGLFTQAAEEAWSSFLLLVAFVIRISGVVVPLGLVALIGWGLHRRFSLEASSS